MQRLIILSLAVLIVTGCARRPDAIAPAAIPLEAYTTQSCDELASLLIAERQTLSVLEAQQNSAATGDAFGVFLVGVPISSLAGGDQEGNIAVSKGKVEAMEAARLRNRC
jgi:hypothetical protein